MKRRITIFFILSHSILTFAQESKAKFSLSIFISPNLASRILSADNSIPEQIVNIFNEIEDVKFGYSGGILAGYSFNPKLSLQAGISITDNGYRIAKNDLRWGSQFDSTGFNPAIPPPSGSPTAIKFIYRHYFIDIPIQVKYSFFTKKKIGIYAVAGTEINFNIGNRQVVTYWYGDNKERENMKDKLPDGNEYGTCNLSVIAGMGIDFSLNSMTTLFIQPTYRQMLLSDVTNHPPIKRRYYSVGLVTGVTFNL